MKTVEYRSVDKSGWGDGPWQQEPDKVQWQDEATGLPCLIVRNLSGALCGYVGVAEGHPWFGIGYSDRIDRVETEERDWSAPTPDGLIEVHGGLTFSGLCNPSAPEDRGICHKPAPGEPDHVWWFGFDCAHAWDLSPGRLTRFWSEPDEVYRDITYVRRQVVSLAGQLAKVAVTAAEIP